MRKVGLIANSGAIGVAQQIQQVVRTAWDKPAFGGKTAVESSVILRTLFWDQVLKRELEIARQAKEVVGQSVAAMSATVYTMVALPISKRAELIQFDQQGAPELASEDLPCIALGSGQAIADPFLAFLRRVFWPTRLPSVREGVLGVVWSLQHAIATSPGFVGDPMQVAVLEHNGKDWEARELSDEDLQEHRENIKNGEACLVEAMTAKAEQQCRVGTVPAPPIPEPVKDATTSTAPAKGSIITRTGG